VTRSKKQSRAIPLLSLRAFVAYKKGKTYILKSENWYRHGIKPENLYMYILNQEYFTGT
jgi:hypothetical protein